MENKFWRITLDTNPEDCNLSCIMCEEHSPFSKFKQRLRDKTGEKVRRMPKEWLDDIFEEAATMGVKEIIPSTMGEPLLYAHFDHFLDLCQRHRIMCNLTTNGTFPKKSVFEWAEVIVPVTSDVKISWNGATEATSQMVMEGIDFNRVLENVKEFMLVRDRIASTGGNFCRVTFQLTFMQNNMHELDEIIKLAASLGVDRVKGHQLWAHFDEIKNLSFKTDIESIRKWNQYVVKAEEAAEKYRKPDGSKMLLEQIIPLAETSANEVPSHYECPFLGKELWISARGKISPCCAPDDVRQTLGDFGTYGQTGIADVLQSEAYQRLTKEYKNIQLCKTCNMRKPT